MNSIQKKALSIQKQNVAEFERQKDHTIQFLLQNPEFKSIYTQEKQMLVDLSKKQQITSQEKQKFVCLQNQITELAKKLDAKTEFFDEHLCSLCNDKGFVGGKECKCLKKIMSQMLLTESGINTHMDSFENVKFDRFEKPEIMKKIYKTAFDWTQKFDKSAIKNWGFFGHTGTGKTHLMLTMANKLIADGHFVVFTTAFNFNNQMLSQHTDFENKDRDYISKYLDCDVLFIDDLGTEPSYNNVTENYLYLIINQRTMENKPIIYSTNFDLALFEQNYGERIFSRLVNKRHSKTLWFDGEDIRLKK